MANYNPRQRYAIDQKNKQRLLKLNPNLDNKSGIYILTREENGIKYGYVGQAVKILNRMISHLSGYQHIDLSLKKHGLYDAQKNPNGWKLGFLHYPEDKLDEMEQHWIREYANAGYQMRNKTTGSQGVGKSQMDDYKPAKGYRDGIAQGRKNLARELYNIVDKHLMVTIQPEKRNHKISQKMFNKFWELLMTDERELDDGDIQKCPNDILDGCEDS